MEGENYQNQTQNELQDKVEKKFDEIEDENGYGTNDEKEIYQAGAKVCEDLLSEITKQSGFTEFQGPLKKKQEELNAKMKDIKSYTFFTNNEVLINDIAAEIDNAENEVQELMKKYQEEQNRKQTISEVTKTEAEVENTGKNYFDIDDDGLMTMTRAVNVPTIQTVLGTVFKNNSDTVYKIDYATCTNMRIKNKMINTIGTPSCYIKYDSSADTYNLYTLGTDGKAVQTSQRALIREGVTLIRDDIAVYNARKKHETSSSSIEQNQIVTESDIDLNNIDSDSKWGPIKKAIPKGLLEEIEHSDNGNLLKNFLVANENRLDEIIRDAKKHGYELHTNPIGKKWASGLMEVKLINGNAEKDVTLWKDENTAIGDDLYDLLDGEESDYKTFLTTRIQQKWHDYDYLTKHENILSENEGGGANETILTPEKRQGVVYGLNTFRTFIDGVRKSNGNSWATKNDRVFSGMLKQIDNSLYSLRNTENISEEDVKEKIITPLQNLWINFQINNPNNTYSLYHGRNNQPFYTAFNNIFLGTEEDVISGIRKLSKWSTVYDNTESSFLKDEIVNQGKLELKDGNINTIFQKISTDLNLSGNETEADLVSKKKLIDGLYLCDTQQKIADFLADKGMLQKKWESDEGTKKMILSGCTKLLNSWQAKNRQIENMNNNSESVVNQMKDGISQEKQLLEQELHKTDEELKRLQALTVLLSKENETYLNKYLTSMYRSSLDAMKYGGVGAMVQSNLASFFVEIGGGAKGDLGNIMNDIEGYGFWDLSDENTKIVGDICKEIAIMVVTSVLTAGIGGAAITGALSLARMGATGLKMTNMAMKLSKIIEISKTSISALRAMNGLNKGARMATYAIKGATTVSSLLVEAPIFNSVNKLIHGATDRDFGSVLDGLDLNPTSKENIHTAAFLGALQVGGSIAKGIGNVAKTSKLGKAITTKVDFTKGLQKFLVTNPVKNAGSMVTEFATMMGAEQAMNVTFGYETVDGNGNVMTERGLHWDQQGIITSIGMILGMRAVKPSLWHRIEQKMVDKNLQILNNTTNPKEPYMKIVDAKGQSKNIKLNDFVKNAEKYLNESQIKSEAKGDIVEQSGDVVKGKPTEAKRSIPEKTTKNKYRSAKPVERARGGELRSSERIKELQARNLEKKGSLEKEVSRLESEISTLKAKQKEIINSLEQQPLIAKDIGQVLNNGDVVTIDGAKYQYLSKGNKFVKTRESKNNSNYNHLANEVKVNHPRELLDKRFNLEPGNKETNKGRNDRLNSLLAQENKIPKLADLNKKINALKPEKVQLENELKKINANPSNPALNEYFRNNAESFVGKKVWINGVEYTGQPINKNGALQFKYIGGKKNFAGEQNFTVSSFAQLKAKGQVNGFSDKGDVILQKGEGDNHTLLNDKIAGEKSYLEKRNVDTEQSRKNIEAKIAEKNAHIAELEQKLPTAREWQTAINQRANELKDKTIEINKNEQALAKAKKELAETERLAEKYEQDLKEAKKTKEEVKETQDISVESFDFAKELPEGYSQKEFLDKILTFESNGGFELTDLTITKEIAERYQQWRVSKNTEGNYIIEKGISTNSSVPHANYGYEKGKILSKDVIEGHKSKEINRKSEEVNKEFKEAEKRGNYKDINLDQVAKTKQNATAFLKGTQQRIREFSGEITKNTKKFIGRLKAKMSEIAKNFPSLKDKIMEYRVNLETKVIDSMNKQEYGLFKNELGREISVLKDHGGSKEAINKLTNSYLDCIGVKESLQICEKEIALNKIKGKDNAKLIEEKTNLEQKLGEKMNEFYKIKDEVTPKNKTVKEKSENPKQTEEVKEKKEEVNKTKEDDSRNDMADMFKETSRDFSEKYGGSDAIGKFIDKNQYSAYHRQIWLYNKFVSSRENSYNLENGGKAEYKLHINATEQNFETVVKEFGNFFLENKIGAKVAPGIKVSKAEMGKQQGKIFTVYAQDHAEMMAVVNKAKEIYKTHNVEGISYSELKNNNANLQYELPIKETGGLVYYGLEKYSPTQDGELGYIGYNGYSERLDLMKKNKGSGPLDNLADWSVLENK